MKTWERKEGSPSSPIEESLQCLPVRDSASQWRVWWKSLKQFLPGQVCIVMWSGHSFQQRPVQAYSTILVLAENSSLFSYRIVGVVKWISNIEQMIFHHTIILTWFLFMFMEQIFSNFYPFLQSVSLRELKLWDLSPRMCLPREYEA